jgi:hypothetical protein
MDSLEAPPDAPLTPEAVPEVIEIIRGDSKWLDPRTILEDILNGSNPPSESRRKWYNQITASADAWTSPQEFDAGFRDEQPADGEAIVMFGDGSKSDDNTALIGVRISDGLTFPIGVWIPETVKSGGREYPVPIRREMVDRRVSEAFETWNVYGFWFDPSDARDDETGERYWEPWCDQWAQRYGRKLFRLPAVKTGMHQHPVIWDMRNPSMLKLFTEATERALSDIVDGTLLHNCPQPSVGGLGVRMRQHVLNARRRPNKFGVSIGKEHRESRKKIDAAVCMIGARMMWLHYNGQTKKGRAPGDGSVTTWNW